MPKPHSRTISVALLWASCALAGCGGSSTATQSANKPISHAPAAAVRAVQIWTRAIASRRCAAIAAVTYTPVSPARCATLLGGLPAPKLVAVAEYGPAVVADLGLQGGRRAAAVFLLAGSHGWRFISSLGTRRPIVGTHPLDGSAAVSMLHRVLPAIARGSCTAVSSDFFAASAVTARRRVARRSRTPGPTAADCFGLTGTPLEARLAHGYGPPSLLGANARIAFYRVGTGAGRRQPYVVLVVRQANQIVLFQVFALLPRATPAGP